MCLCSWLSTALALYFCEKLFKILLDGKKPFPRCSCPPVMESPVSPIVVKPFGQCRGPFIRSVSALMSDHPSVGSLCL